MKRPLLAMAIVTFLSTLACTEAAPNVRLKSIDPIANTFVIKNYGSDAENVTGWIISSRGTNFGFWVASQLTTSGSPVIAPGGELAFQITGFDTFLDRKNDSLALHSAGGINASTMEDYIVWGASGGFNESNAIFAGIWASGDFVEFGESFRYIGDGTDTGPRKDQWQSQRTNIRLLSVDASNKRFSVKNFDTVSCDVSPWFFTVNNFNLSPNVSTVNLQVISGSTLLDPGDVVTFQVNQVQVLPEFGSIGIYRSNNFFFAPGMVDFVQWGYSDGIREPVANTLGIWTTDAHLGTTSIHQYDGDGSETGSRESWWDTGGVLPITPSIEATFTFDEMGDLHLEFSTISGHKYEVQHTDNLGEWISVSPAITATGSTFAWTDINAADVERRFYRVVDVTP